MIGQKIRELRKENNLTQAELARLLEMTKTGVALWESNQRVPDIIKLQKIAKFFNVSVDWILNDSVHRQILIPNEENTMTILGKNGVRKTYKLTDNLVEALKVFTSSLETLDEDDKK